MFEALTHETAEQAGLISDGLTIAGHPPGPKRFRIDPQRAGRFSQSHHVVVFVSKHVHIAIVGWFSGEPREQS
jgi:hypothetical protein